MELGTSKDSNANNNVPWLLIPEDEAFYHLMHLPVAGQEILHTYGLKEEGIYHVNLPKMQMQNHVIRGSSHGWLFMITISEGNMLMLNPFTNVQLDLPHISTLPSVINYEPDNHGHEHTLLNFRDTTCYFDRVFTHKLQIWKVIINSSPDCNNHNFMAVVIYGFRQRLAFYKPYDMRWVDFPTRDTDFEDVIFFGEKIYAVNFYGQLYEFDTNTKSGRLEGGIHEVGPPSGVSTGDDLTLKYVIGCANGSLLMVPLGRSECETDKFDIYELKKIEKKWSRIHSLDNYILIVGFTSSVQIPASFPYIENQIYFSDIGVYSLEKINFYRILSDVNFYCPPIWLLP